MIGYFIRRIFSQILLLTSLIVIVSLGLGILTTPHVTAAITQIQESPEQMVYQSRQTLGFDLCMIHLSGNRKAILIEFIPELIPTSGS